MIAGAGALLFAGFVLYDTSRIVRTHPTTDSVGAALDLFVDFFGLFLYVLQLMMLLAGGRD
jgi:FtsH-binding integral membrane protein